MNELLPGSAAWPAAPPAAARVEGPGPEQAAYGRLAASGAAARAGLPVMNRALSGHAGRRVSYADRRSPQIFKVHPAVRDAASTASVGIETSFPHLPGRQPPAGWDGEPGATSPALVR